MRVGGRSRLPAILFALAVCLPSTARAQTIPAGTDRAPESAWEFHRGFTIAFSLGGGTVVSSACEGCSRPRALGVDASLGLFARPRLALMYDVFAVTTAEPSDVASTGTVLQSFAVQYWFTPTLWVKGGIGAARFLAATPVGTPDATGGGMTLGAGYEIWRGETNFAVSLQGRLAQCEIGQAELTSFAVLLGLNWY